MTSEPDLDEEIEPGAQVVHGRYTIVERLGRGGYSTVYLARNLSNADIALKILAKKYRDHVQARQRLDNEATVAQALDAVQGVVRVVDSGQIHELDMRPYLAMKFAGGPTLAARLVQTTYSVTKASTIALSVAKTLAAIHACDVVHRDVKPSNIIVPADGSMPVLIDFGLAQSKGTFVPASPRVTLGNERPGTKHHMPPEQALGLGPTPAFDLYALTSTLWAMLLGRSPLAELSPDDAVRRKCDVEAPELSIAGRRDDIPEALVSLIDESLRRNPAGRPQSASEFAGRLEAIIAKLAPGQAANRSKTPDNAVATPCLMASPGLAPVAPSAATSDATSNTRLHDHATERPGTAHNGHPSSRRHTRRWLALCSLTIAATTLVIAALRHDASTSNADADARTQASQPSSSPTPTVTPTVPARATDDTPPPPSNDSVLPVTHAPAPEPVKEDVKPKPRPSAPSTQPGSSRTTKPPKPKPRKGAEANPTKPSSVDCSEIVEDTNDAVSHRHWLKAYALTGRRYRKCWKVNLAAYHRIRVDAAFETGHFDECVRVAADVQELRRQYKLCRASQDTQ